VRRRRNADEARRRSERAVDFTPEEAAEVLHKRLRAGELLPWHVGLLKLLGFKAALLLPYQRGDLVRCPVAGSLSEEDPGAWTWSSRPLFESFQAAFQRREQGQIMRVFCVGAAKDVARICYEPLIAYAREVSGCSWLFDPEDAVANLPLEILARAEAQVRSSPYGIGAGAHSPAPDLQHFAGELSTCDFGGESAVSEFAHATISLSGLMVERSGHPMPWRLALQAHARLVETLAYAAEIENDVLPGEPRLPLAAVLRALDSVGWKDPVELGGGGGYVRDLERYAAKYLTGVGKRYLIQWVLQGPPIWGPA